MTMAMRNVIPTYINVLGGKSIGRRDVPTYTTCASWACKQNAVVNGVFLLDSVDIQMGQKYVFCMMTIVSTVVQESVSSTKV